jgi:hypothetical protein
MPSAVRRMRVPTAARTMKAVNQTRLHMSTREARLGADVLRLVDHLHSRPNGRQRRLPLLRSAVTAAFEASVLAALARRLASSRALRFASAATAAYLKRRVDRQRAQDR